MYPDRGPYDSRDSAWLILDAAAAWYRKVDDARNRHDDVQAAHSSVIYYATALLTIRNPLKLVRVVSLILSHT